MVAKAHHGLTSYSWDRRFLVRSASIVWEAQFIFKRVEQFVSTKTKRIPTCIASLKPLFNDIMPCSNHFVGKESPAPRDNHDDVFHTQSNDNEKAMSIEDRRFLEIMQRSIKRNEQRNWETSLPLREVNPIFPNNRVQAVERLNKFIQSFKKKP
jgi:hypothetical protein